MADQKPVNYIIVDIGGHKKVYTVDKMKKMYPNLANRLASGEINLRTFKNLSRKKINREFGGGKVQAQDRLVKAKAYEANPEQVQESWRKAKSGGRQSAEYRARKLAAITGEYYIPAFRAELDEIYRLSSLFPDKFDVDHIKRLAGNLEELGGKHEPRNLQILKKKLHGLKTALENSGNFEDAARVGAFNEYNLAPNVRGLLAENVLGKKGLMNFVGDAYQKIKPGLKFAGKTALRAVPIAGAGVSIAQANEYRKAGQDKLAAMAALSASQGPLGLAGLAGEMGGLLWNKATKRKRFPEGQQGWRQSLLDPNHPGLGGG
jgi:hypothetical protein